MGLFNWVSERSQLGDKYVCPVCNDRLHPFSNSTYGFCQDHQFEIDGHHYERLVDGQIVKWQMNGKQYIVAQLPNQPTLVSIRHQLPIYPDERDFYWDISRDCFDITQKNLPGMAEKIEILRTFA
jgi:hypothetical protein